MSEPSRVPTFNILLVEDNEADIYLVRKALEGAELDFRLMVIEDGEEAVSFARRDGKFTDSSPPHLVLLDLNLPNRGGVEVLETLRRNIYFKRVPVFVLFSSASPCELTKVNHFQVEALITKPANLVDFLKIGYTVKEFLQRTRDRPPKLSGLSKQVYSEAVLLAAGSGIV